MTKDEVENVSPEVEMLARMWIKCDPNRGGDGCNPDDLSTLHIDGEPQERPRWMWFIPRAKSSLKYFTANSYVLAKS